MTPERWRQIERLFHAALTRAPEERSSFLGESCGGDEALRSEVESLLASDGLELSVVEVLPAEVAARMFAAGQAANLVGEIVGRYHVLSRLGAGGMGEVYLAEDSTLRRKVALKVLPPGYTADAERVRRFEQEARAASALNHPNIITIHEIGHWQDAQFIVTEFVEGQTLRQRMQQGRIPVDELLDISIQAASALAAAHGAGIVHRDIKPANIMVRQDGYVKVLDFGLAKLTADSSEGEASRITEAKTDPGRVMGTVNYMSPEQALGKQIDARTDIFSFGVVLYEMASGTTPFGGDSEAAVYNAILNHTPPSLSQAPALLPEELAGIIRRMLEKDRELRHRTAAALRDDLKRVQRNLASHDSSAVARKVARPKLARPLYLAALLLIIAAGGIALLSGVLRRRPAEAVGQRPAVSALPQNVSFAQQTDQPGTEYFPTLSPDGQMLVYASQESGNWDLWQETIGQRGRVNLTVDSPSDDTQPAFSPDGKQLAFRSERDGGGLFILDVQKRAVKKVSGEGYNPTWSADGSEIAYSTSSVTVVEGHSLGQLWVVRVADGEKRLVAGQDALQPAWSPHGQRIAFWGMRGDLWTIPAGGGVPVRINEDNAINWNPCWSADGKYLYFTSDRNGSMNLWRVPLDETSGQALGAPEPAMTPATDMLHLSISRNGHRMAYVQRTKQRHLQSLAFDPVTETTRGAPSFITRGTSFASHPSLSPDGQWLAYSSAGSPQEDIYVIRTDGTGLRQLTNDPARDRLPRWSPDGKRIAFFSDREGANEIWAVAPDGAGQVERLTYVGNERAIFPTWSPDAKALAYYLDGVGSFLIDLSKPWQQQTPQPIGINGKQDADLAVWDWSPDGKKMACELYQHDSQQDDALAVYSFATPEAAPRLEIVAKNADFPAWLGDSRRLLFGRAGKLYLADLQTKQTREIYAPAPNEAAEYCILTRDNRTIYYSLSTTEADIWLATLE